MIALDDVKKHLGDDAGRWSDEAISAALAAEHSAQRSVTRWSGTRPAELDDALLRRVAHNLAENGEKGGSRVGVNAPEVRDLEQAYGTRVSAVASEEDDASSGTTRRTTKKAAAKKATGQTTGRND